MADDRLRPEADRPHHRAAAEAAIRAEHKRIPCVILRLAGLYDEHSMVPTMAQQMPRIYERDFQSYFYSGSTLVGQAILHTATTCSKRSAAPSTAAMCCRPKPRFGEPDALQDEFGYLIHGVDDWPTLRLPKPSTVTGARKRRLTLLYAAKDPRRYNAVVLQSFLADK